jgi:hypothetical protein
MKRMQVVPSLVDHSRPGDDFEVTHLIGGLEQPRWRTDCRDLLYQCHVPAERHPVLAAESPKETLAPRHNAIAAQHRHHGAPALASLLKWHPQCCLQCFGDGVGVVTPVFRFSVHTAAYELDTAVIANPLVVMKSAQDGT